MILLILDDKTFADEGRENPVSGWSRQPDRYAEIAQTQPEFDACDGFEQVDCSNHSLGAFRGFGCVARHICLDVCAGYGVDVDVGVSLSDEGNGVAAVVRLASDPAEKTGV